MLLEADAKTWLDGPHPLECECTDCGGRVRAGQHPGEREGGDGVMQDVSVPRE